MQWDKLVDQEKLDDGITLDAFIMKSWLFQRKYHLAVNLSMSNLLDTQDIISGGFEQLRYDRRDVDKFPPKYSYMYGRTYYAQLTFSLNPMRTTSFSLGLCAIGAAATAHRCKRTRTAHRRSRCPLDRWSPSFIAQPVQRVPYISIPPIERVRHRDRR
jgi:hypothetical protein